MVEYKSVKFKLSSWKKLRRAFYGRKNETFSDYIERIAGEFKAKSKPKIQYCPDCGKGTQSPCEECNCHWVWKRELKNE